MDSEIGWHEARTKVAAGVAHMQRLTTSYPPIISVDTKPLIGAGAIDTICT